jgi:hypothetical protein
MTDYIKTAFISSMFFSLGWIVSASTIGNECQKLGGFYVGSTVYECAVKEKK